MVIGIIEHMHSTWRVLYHPPAQGAWNMAVDESILESVLDRQSPPTLRLYAWQPACLSLGFSQPVSDVDCSSIASQGWELVRRPTGGRAILHTDELTYSVCGLLNEPALQGTLLDSYFQISRALQAALQEMGLETSADEKYTLPAGAHPKGAVCFEVPSNYEITAGGKKLIGSAQARRKDGLLQHGALPLVGDLGRITQALTFPDEQSRLAAAERVRNRAATVESLTGLQIEWMNAANAFEKAFSDTLGIHFNRGDLTEDEKNRARDLVAEKYANPVWTERI